MDGRELYLRPSAAGTWSSCDGYAALASAVSAALPDDYEEATDNDIREDGTACHWLAEAVWADPLNLPPIGSLSPNGRVITEDMYEAVELYHSVLDAWRPNIIYIELKMPVSKVCAYVQDGTPDAFSYDAKRHRLFIADLKYGFRFVEVWHNKQLTLYIFAIILYLGINPEGLEIEMTIVQPRCYGTEGAVRTVVTTYDELLPLMEELRFAAFRAMGPQPQCHVSDKCLNCVGRHACGALQKAALVVIEMAHDSTPQDLDGWQLGRELRTLEHAQKLLEARVTGLQEQALYVVRNKRQHVYGYDLRSKKGRERWKEGSKEKALQLGWMFKLQGQTQKDPEPVSPAKMRKLGVPSDVVAAMAESPDLGLTLVRSDENEVAKKFSKYNPTRI